jgi:hypothetical protein
MNKMIMATNILVCTALLTSGCSLANYDLLEKSDVKIETVSVAKAKYLYTNVFQEGENIVISGTVALDSPETAWNARGHLDVYVRDGSGDLLMASHTPYRQHHRIGKRNQVKYYTAARLLVKDAVTITLRHHFAELSVHESAPIAN